MVGAVSRRARLEGEELVVQPKLSCLLGVGMDFIKGAPCDFLMHLEDQAEVIDGWLQSLKCIKRQRKQVLNCLGETYLRKLPLVGKSRPWPKNPVAKNYRYQFRAQISKVLG